MINDDKPSDNLLAQAEQQVENNLTPQNRGDYMKAVVAGMKAAMSGGPDSIVASLKDSKDPVRDCAVGAVNLLMLLRKQSRNTMPLKALAPAAATLMFKGLDFAEKMGLVQINQQTLAQAGHFLGDRLMQVFQITPQMMQTAMGKIRGLANDPAAVEKMKAVAGQQGGADVSA